MPSPTRLSSQIFFYFGVLRGREAEDFRTDDESKDKQEGKATDDNLDARWQASELSLCSLLSGRKSALDPSALQIAAAARVKHSVR